MTAMGSIEVSPYKISLDEVEIYLDEDVSLKPGQMLCFESDSPVYGQVVAMKSGVSRGQSSYGSDEGALQVARIRILFGQPSFGMDSARILTPEEMGRDIQRIKSDIEYPLQLGEGFAGDFWDLGTLTVIDGESIGGKCHGLTAMMDAVLTYQRILVIDPLGIFGHDEGIDVLYAGQDCHMSLQDVGLKRLTTCLLDLLPENLAEQAVGYLSRELSLSDEFLPYRDILHPDRLASFNASAPMTQGLQMIERQHVFANDEAGVFSIDGIAGNATALNLSKLAEPWKTLFYEQALIRMLSNAEGDIVPVLIYPENYLAPMEPWIRKADEAGLTMLLLASPYLPDDIRDMADNELFAEDDNRFLLSGRLTCDLPVRFSLPESGEREDEQAPAAVPPVTAPAPEPLPPAPQPTEAEAPAFEDGWVPIGKSIPAAPEPTPPEPAPEFEPTPAPPPMQEKETQDFTDETDMFVTGEFPVFKETVEEAPAAEVPVTEAPPESPAGESEGKRYDSILGETDPDDFNFDIALDQKIDQKPGQSTEPTPTPAPGPDETLFEPPPAPSPEPPAPEAAEAFTEPEFESAGFEPVLEATEEAAGLPEPEEPTPASTGQTNGFKPGDKVRHKDYGMGIVSKVIPMEESVIVSVVFENAGKRTMDPVLANLEKL